MDWTWCDAVSAIGNVVMALTALAALIFAGIQCRDSLRQQRRDEELERKQDEREVKARERHDRELRESRNREVFRDRQREISHGRHSLLCNGAPETRANHSFSMVSSSVCPPKLRFSTCDFGPGGSRASSPRRPDAVPVRVTTGRGNAMRFRAYPTHGVWFVPATG